MKNFVVPLHMFTLTRVKNRASKAMFFNVKVKLVLSSEMSYILAGNVSIQEQCTLRDMHAR